MDGAGGNSGFGWVLVIVGLVIAAIGSIWVPELTPEILMKMFANMRANGML